MRLGNLSAALPLSDICSDDSSPERPTTSSSPSKADVEVSASSEAAQEDSHKHRCTRNASRGVANTSLRCGTKAQVGNRCTG
ncbi:hypothetical protein ACLKA6_008654 [Drosophila palustris]